MKDIAGMMILEIEKCLKAEKSQENNALAKDDN
jgi:hypothetical protein